MKSGVIYYFTSKSNGRVYVGSTSRLPNQRRLEHLHLLRKGKHHCRHLQSAYAKYGEADLEFGIVEHVEDVIFLIAREQFHIWRHGRNVMNCAPVSDAMYAAHAANRGRVMSSEEREMRSAAMKGKARNRVWTEDARRAHSIALTGRKMPPVSSERRQNISAAKKGKKRTPEAIAAASAGKARVIEAEVPSWLALMEEGKSYREIDRITGRSRSVIARECKKALAV